MINEKLDRIEKDLLIIKELANTDYFKHIEKQCVMVTKANDEYRQENEKLKSIIKEAIEYINKNKKTLTKQTVDFYNNDELAKGKLKIGTFMWHVDELLEILDKENK